MSHMLHMYKIKQLEIKITLFVTMTCFFLFFSNYLSIAESLNTTNISQLKNCGDEVNLNKITNVILEKSSSPALRPVRCYVDCSVGISGDGTSWATAFKTIREAIATVTESSEIWVKAGTYLINSEPGSDPGGIVIDKVLYLFGSFTGREMSPDERSLTYNRTVLNAEQKGRCFSITKNVYLDGFNLENGLVDSYDPGGGAITITDCSPALKHCIFKSNKIAGNGGAIYIKNGSPYLQDCQFHWNGSEDGYSWQVSAYGGAIYIYNGYPTLLDCTFNGNSVIMGSGGAINGSANIVNCRFDGNCCQYGGSGGAIDGDNLNIQHSTFYDNKATYAAGAICGNGNFIDCRFDQNFSSDGGAAITVTGYSSKTNIVNCIFANNAASNQYQFLGAEGGGAVWTGKNTDTYVFNSLFVRNRAGITFPLNGAAYSNGGNSYILNCTFWDNTVNTIYYTGEKYTEGGTVYNKPGQSLKIAKSILWNNHGSPVEISGGAADVAYCVLIQENLANINNNLASDPLFIDPSSGNLKLRPDSPCSYAGSNLNAAPLSFVSDAWWSWIIRHFI